MFVFLFVQALKVNTSLVELTLRSNSIGVVGLISIGNALYKNSTLKSLSLWGNGFEHDSCTLFHELFETRFPYVGLKLDIKTYFASDVYQVAECSL